MDIEFDQRFIDMNLPHHASIIAAAVVALTRLEHPRLREIAMDIVMDQTAEIDELREMRARLYGDSAPMPLSKQMLEEALTMPGMEGIDPAGMATQLDPAAMAEQMGADGTIDLVFIDLTVAHHQNGTIMAQAAQKQAVSDELRAMARKSESAQASQIEELQQIRDALSGAATPKPGE